MNTHRNLLAGISWIGFDDSDRGRVRIVVSLPEAAIAFLAVFITVIVASQFVPAISVLQPVVGFVVTVMLPGLLFLQLLGLEPASSFRQMAYAVGVSLLLTMVTGGVINLVLPAVGLKRPLSVLPLAAGVVTTNFALAMVAGRMGGQADLQVAIPTSVARLSIPRLLFLLFPPGAILAVEFLNGTNVAVPLVVVLIAIAAVPVAVAAGAVRKHHFPLALWAMTLAILLHKSLWAVHTYGGHLSVVTIYEQQHWPLVGETLLPNAILMPAMARLLGIGILAQVKIVLPILVSVLPIFLYTAFRELVDARQAFLGACLFVFAHPFYLQYPSTPRASVPVLFLAGLGAIICDTDLPETGATLLGLMFAVGLAVSHYGTSYYVLFAVFGALATLAMLGLLDAVHDWLLQHRAAGDGGRPVVSTDSLLNRLRNNRLIDWEYVIFYAVVVVGWYLYVSQGTKFGAIVEKIINSYRSLFLQGGGVGSTAVRLATDYGSVSIALSKDLYIVIAGLVGVGLTLTYLRRFYHLGDTDVSDEYLALATLLFLLFGGSFIISGQWGGGRPMMIVLSFNAVFAVIAAGTAGRWFVKFLRKVTQTVVSDQPAFPCGATVGSEAFAVLIAVFFIINSGVASAIAYHDEAPSNVPNSDLDTVYIQTDIQTHVWLADHRRVGVPIYGDREARAQTTDWVNGEIAARSERLPYRFKKSKFLGAIDDPGLESGYIILIGDNVVKGEVEVSYIRTRPIKSYSLSLPQRNRIYTTGQSTVYATNVSAALPPSDTT